MVDRVHKHLAWHLGELRRLRNLSQAGLAKLTGIPRSTLTHIESGQGNPSLANLAKLARTLQVSVEELISPPHAKARVIRAAELTVQTRAQNQAQIYKLLPKPIPGMEFDKMVIQPGARMGGVPHVAGSSEYFCCIRGRFKIYVESDQFELGEGDVIQFSGDQRHSYENTGRQEAVGVSVVTLAAARS